MTEKIFQAATELLEDISSTGRPIDWRARKMANEYLAVAYDEIDQRKADRLRSCATRLVYGVASNGHKKLRAANFCRVRLCPICQWRRSLKLYGQMMRVMQYLQPQGFSYIFLTLTIRNVVASELTGALDQIQEGYHRLAKYDDFKKVVHGWYRGLEVTHNLDRNSPDFDTFHPHLHVVLAVKPSYFNSRYYISQARWGELWRRALGVDYIPIVDVRKVKGDTARAVCEATKYTAKSKDYIVLDDWQLTIDTVSVLDNALHARKLIGFGGILRDARKALEQDDPDTGDLIQVSDIQEQDQEDEYYISYGWHTGYSQYLKEAD